MSEKAKKTVLAMDTALGGVSVGIMAANGHIVSRMEETSRGQAAMLVPMIQEVLAEAQTGFDQLDLIACSIGPGSFTGLRIGLSTARTLGLALNIPVVGLNTLDVMARHYCISPNPQAEGPVCSSSSAQARGRDDTGKSLLIVLETKRQDFYARYYDIDGQPLGEPVAANGSVILGSAPKEPFSVGGDCLNRFQQVVSGDFECLDELTQPDPILMAQIGLEIYENNGDQGIPQPLYLRGADVSQPKTPPRKLEQAS